MKRRDFLQFSSMLSLVLFGNKLGALNSIAYASESTPIAFSREWLETQARDLSQQSYKPPLKELPDNYLSLNYDTYRDIRYRPERALWQEQAYPFHLQFLHTGFLYKYPIDLHIVKDGQASKIYYSKDLFSFGQLVEEPKPEEKAGFSGFRIHAPLNQKDYYDEFVVFQGASYFRAIAANQVYGLSARGLAIDTGQPDGEEFPIFRKFWIEEPEAGSRDITVHALLDSESVAGAYSFTIFPGRMTTLEVTSTLFPRRTLNHVGIAPLTSMFLHSPSKPRNSDDFRPRVHDSEALTILNGKNEWIWRPLINPRKLQFAAFLDEDPIGFGFAQRKRDFYDYQDLEARYERRPSLWVEPIGSWGRGYVELVEIPTNMEIHDNIVAYWQPRDDLIPGRAYQYNYKLHWGSQPEPEQRLAQVIQTRTGRAGAGVTLENTNRLFVIDFKFSNLSLNTFGDDITPDIMASDGAIKNIVLRSNAEKSGMRLTFEYEPEGSVQADIRAVLQWQDRQVSEIWLYRWET